MIDILLTINGNLTPPDCCVLTALGDKDKSKTCDKKCMDCLCHWLNEEHITTKRSDVKWS